MSSRAGHRAAPQQHHALSRMWRADIRMFDDSIRLARAAVAVPARLHHLNNRPDQLWHGLVGSCNQLAQTCSSRSESICGPTKTTLAQPQSSSECLGSCGWTDNRGQEGGATRYDRSHAEKCAVTLWPSNLLVSTYSEGAISEWGEWTGI